MEEGLAKVPKLDLAQYKYALTQEVTHPNPNKAATQSGRSPTPIRTKQPLSQSKTNSWQE